MGMRMRPGGGEGDEEHTEGVKVRDEDEGGDEVLFGHNKGNWSPVTSFQPGTTSSVSSVKVCLVSESDESDTNQ